MCIITTEHYKVSGTAISQEHESLGFELSEDQLQLVTHHYYLHSLPCKTQDHIRQRWERR